MDHFDKLINRIADSKILVIGDLMLDRFVYGHVERISPESPVPVLAITHENFMLGGAGNALSNLAGLGAHAELVAITGADSAADKIKSLIEKLGYSADALLTDESRPSIVKTRYLAGHQQLLRTDEEQKKDISDGLAESIIEKTRAALKNDIGAIIISDYGKGLLRDDVIAGIIEAAKAAAVPVIVDPKGYDFSKYKGASALTPNKKELNEASKMAVGNDKEIIAASESLISSCNLEAIIATRSGEGMSIIESGKPPIHYRGADIEVFDVSGAGDTVIATVAAALAAGGTLAQAAALANIAGSIVVTKVGTAPIRLAELKAALHSDQGDGLVNNKATHAKTDRARRGDILSINEATEQVQRWKARGLKVGFTNGCFDILHFGHVTYLNDARDHCDRLILGLNKDSSIRILKGDGRPVHDEQSRAHVLAALGSIDVVCLFGAEKQGDDNTACALLDMLKPDIYFKGGDYTIEQIPEAPTVLKNGGEVKVMPVYDGHSTTKSISKIKTGEKNAA